MIPSENDLKELINKEVSDPQERDISLMAVLPKEITVTDKKGNKQKSPLVAIIRPNNFEYDRNNNITKTNIFITAYEKKDFNDFLQKHIDNDRIMYLKQKKTPSGSASYQLKVSISASSLPNIDSAHPQTSLYNNNITRYKFIVNKYLIKTHPEMFKFIPQVDLTKDLCDFAVDKKTYNIKIIPDNFFCK